MMFGSIPVTDAHVHFSMQAYREGLEDFLSATGTDSACLAAVSHSRCISLNSGALVIKRRSFDRFFVFGSLDAGAYYLHRDTLGEYMAWYAEKLRLMGCDGVKMLEGKPQMRKLLPVPDFDAPCWESFWDYAEKTSLPILMHINDPENFWSEDAPAWAKAQGWFYDESYVNNEAQYTQMLNVLERHPKLKIIFAHFFFMSARLERLDKILDAYPNVRVDLTPGIEMYENFSSDIASAGAFFAKHEKRIIYGTDIGGRCVLNGEEKSFNLRENRRRPEIVRRFLSMDGEELVSSDGDFLINRADFIMRGLNLAEDALAAILGGNFRDFVGKPLPVSAEAVLEECARVRREMAELSELYPVFTPDYSCLELTENCLKEAE